MHKKALAHLKTHPDRGEVYHDIIFYSYINKEKMTDQQIWEMLEYNNRQPETRRHHSYSNENDKCATPITDEDMLDRLLANLEEEAVRQAIRSLKPRQQELILDIFYRGLSMAEVARRDGVWKMAVSNRMSKIIKRLMVTFPCVRQSEGLERRKLMNRVKQNVPGETMVDLESGVIWVKSSEKLTGAELRILNLLRRREGKPVTAICWPIRWIPWILAAAIPAFIFLIYAASSATARKNRSLRPAPASATVWYQAPSSSPPIPNNPINDFPPCSPYLSCLPQ